jgi:hypothetical protein
MPLHCLALGSLNIGCICVDDCVDYRQRSSRELVRCDQGLNLGIIFTMVHGPEPRVLRCLVIDDTGLKLASSFAAENTFGRHPIQ